MLQGTLEGKQMAQYGLFVLKVLLNPTNQPQGKQH